MNRRKKDGSQQAKRGFGAPQGSRKEQQAEKQLQPMRTLQRNSILPTHYNYSKAFDHALGLLKKGDLEQSKKILNKLIASGFPSSQPHSYLGAIYLLEENNKDALEHLLLAKDLGEATSQLYTNLGIAYRRIGAINDAINYFSKAASLDPHNPNTLIHLANIIQENGDHRDSIKRYREIIAIKPDLPDAHWGLALSLLSRKEFQEGWNEYEWRWDSKRFSFNYLITKRPVWTPDISHKRILIWGEQGVGDQIMFASMLGQAKQFATQVLVQIDHRLIQLFKPSFPSFIFLSSGDRVDEECYDSHLPMGSLGRYLRTSERAFLDHRKPYLSVRSERSLKLRKMLKLDNRLICGISWTSKASLGFEKSIDLERMAQALNMPSIRLVSLQYGQVDSEIAGVRHELGINIVQPPEIDCTNDLYGLACLIDACDLVVSISNITAHLAGSLGKETWLLLNEAPNWRWTPHNDKCLWYENIRIYQQDVRGVWDRVLSLVRENLLAASSL